MQVGQFFKNLLTVPEGACVVRGSQRYFQSGGGAAPKTLADIADQIPKETLTMSPAARQALLNP